METKQQGRRGREMKSKEREARKGIVGKKRKGCITRNQEGRNDKEKRGLGMMEKDTWKERRSKGARGRWRDERR